MITFVIDEEDTKKYLEWVRNHECKLRYSPGTAIGGKTTFSFTPTSLCEIQKVKCACGSEIDLSNYGDW